MWVNKILGEDIRQYCQFYHIFSFLKTFMYLSLLPGAFSMKHIHKRAHTHTSSPYCLASTKSFSTSSQYMSRLGESGNSHRRILFGNMEENWEDTALKRLTQSQTWIIWWYLECTVLCWERQTPGLQMPFLCLTPPHSAQYPSFKVHSEPSFIFPLQLLYSIL